MQSQDDPELLTAAARLREIAALLAAGVLRLHARAALAADPGALGGPKNSRESGRDGLAVPGETVLSVQRS